MNKDTKYAVFLGVMLTVLLGWTSWSWANASESADAEEPTEQASTTTTTIAPDPIVTVDPWVGLEDAIEQYEAEQFALAVEYAIAVEAAEEQARQEAAERAERERKAQEAAKAAESAPAPQVAPSGDIWWELAGCETGYQYNNPNTGNGYYGYFQFSLSTWQSIGGPGYPHHHSYETQLQYAKKLQAQMGWSPWPYCSRHLGLR